MGDYEQAVQAFDVAARADGRFVDVGVLRRMALARLDRRSEAVEAFTQALALAPERATIHLYRGQALAALGERVRAEQDFQQAAQIADGDRRLVAAARSQLERLRRQ